MKDVPLTVNFIESAGSRLENYTYTLSHSMTLSGDATQMAGISEISLGTLALEDVQGSETLTYDILIPDGVNNLSGSQALRSRSAAATSARKRSVARCTSATRISQAITPSPS